MVMLRAPDAHNSWEAHCLPPRLGNQGLEQEMTTVQIAYDVPDVTVAKIQAHLEEVAACDISWNGAAFKTERGEFTCIADDSVDEYDGTRLLQEIFRIIEGEE